MLRVIIIEDEQHAANLLESMLSDIDASIQVLDKCRDLPEGVKSIRRHSPDVVFLDIELPMYSGIQLLEFFNSEDVTFRIVFTTAYNEYAVRAFEMSAADYLMKPIQEEKLRTALEKITKRTFADEPYHLPVLKQNFQTDAIRKIVVPVSNGFEVLNLKDICYFKADGSYTQIYFVSNTTMLVSKNLKHFEFVLGGINSFLRIHRSFIVNINFVKRIFRKDGGMLVLENNAELPVAEDKMELILEALGKI